MHRRELIRGYLPIYPIYPLPADASVSAASSGWFIRKALTVENLSTIVNRCFRLSWNIFYSCRT